MKKFFLISLAAFGWMVLPTMAQAHATDHFVSAPIICHEFTLSPQHCLGNPNKIKWFNHKLAQIHGCNNTETFVGGFTKWTGISGNNATNGCLLDANEWNWEGDSVTMDIFATSFDGCWIHIYEIKGFDLKVESGSVYFDGQYYPTPHADYEITQIVTIPSPMNGTSPSCQTGPMN